MPGFGHGPFGHYPFGGAGERLWDGALVAAPKIVRSTTDTVWGFTETQTVALRIANYDGTYDGLLTSDPRGLVAQVWRDELSTSTRYEEFAGQVTARSSEAGIIELQAEDLNTAVLETEIPEETVTTTEFGTTCPDAGARIPRIIGTVPKVLLLNVKDDTVNNYYDYLFPRDTPTSPTVTLYREAPTSAGPGVYEAITGAEYTLSTSLYPGRVVARFTTRQTKFDGGLHTLRADITGPTAARNPWRAIKEILTSLHQVVSDASFTAAEAAINAEIVIDGLIDEARPAVDYLDELRMITQGRLAYGSSGWEAIPDEEPTEAALAVGDGIDDGQRNLVTPTSLDLVPTRDQVSLVRLQYRYDYIKEEFTQRQLRPVWVCGQPKEIESRFLRDATAADRVCQRLALEYQYGSLVFRGVLSPEAEPLVEGDIIRVTYAPMALSDVHMRVTRIERGTGEFPFEAMYWHPNLYAYVAGVLPSDPSLGMESDAQLAPAAVTSLSITSSGVRLGTDGPAQAYVRLQYTTGTRHARARIHVNVNGQTAVRQEYHVGTGTVTKEIDGLVPGQSYDYAIWAENVFATPSASAATMTAQVAPGDTSAPATPTGLTVTAIPGKDALITCTLGSEADLKGVRWDVRTASGGGGSLVKTGTISVAPASSTASGALPVNDLTYDTTYYARVLAFDMTGNSSSWSSAVSFVYSPVTAQDVGEDDLFIIGTAGSGAQNIAEGTGFVTVITHNKNIAGPNSIVNVFAHGIIENDTANPGAFQARITNSETADVINWVESLPAGATAGFAIEGAFPNLAAATPATFYLEIELTGMADSADQLLGSILETIEFRRRT